MESLTGWPRNFVGGARAAGTIPCLGFRTGRSRGFNAHTIIACTEYPLEIFGLALGTFHFNVLFFSENQQLKKVLTLATSEFIYRHDCSPAINVFSKFFLFCFYDRFYQDCQEKGMISKASIKNSPRVIYFQAIPVHVRGFLR
jgi:hypothetical protein